VILVAGGTGRLGTLLVNRLVNRHLPVRVLTRQPARAEHLAGDLVTVVSGDVRDPETLAPATAGVDVVVSAVHGFTDPHRNSLAAVDRDGNANLIEAAKRAGADFVLMSTVGATGNSPMELFRMKHAAEQDAAASGVPTTIVRASAFLELWIDLINQTAGRSGRPLVFGRGQNPINFVAVADVAAVVDQAVIDPTTRGKTLEIGGPDNLTFDQLAKPCRQQPGARGHPGTYRLHAPSHGQQHRIRQARARPQARAALAMDHTDLTFDATRLHQLYPPYPARRSPTCSRATAPSTPPEPRYRSSAVTDPHRSRDTQCAEGARVAGDRSPVPDAGTGAIGKATTLRLTVVRAWDWRCPGGAASQPRESPDDVVSEIERLVRLRDG